MPYDAHDTLRDAGCDSSLIERFEACQDSGDTDGCLRLLHAHRCDLVEAMHQAQRPIDVCDWIIYQLESQHA